MKSKRLDNSWFRISNLSDLDSPSLVVYRDRVEANISRMKDIIGDVTRLRPHLKTYKMAEVVELQISAQIDKFKSATIAEAEMAARVGAEDILLAYQPVGPKVERLRNLVHSFPKTKFSALVDDVEAARRMNQAFEGTSGPLEVFLDLDVGMHRTGLAPDDRALDLFKLMLELPNLVPVGVHVYDGHLRQSDIQERTKACDEAFQPVERLLSVMSEIRPGPMNTIAGGTPTFPVHARRPHVTCSPGTCLFWDWGYDQILPDLRFDFAALVISRVISKPGGNLICTDLGHKSIAAENPHPRVHFLNLPGAKAVSQSEEHLVLEVADPATVDVGDELYGVPIHICPTCALYDEAYIVDNKEIITTWRVVARDRRITI